MICISQKTKCFIAGANKLKTWNGNGMGIYEINRTEKSTLLCIDVVAITLSIVLALAIGSEFLAATLGSYLVGTTYLPFFIVALIAYVLLMTVMTEIRVDRLSKREIIGQTIIQQLVLTAVYIAISFVLHKAVLVSGTCMGLFFIFSMFFCGIGRIIYQENCHRKTEEKRSVELSAKNDLNIRTDGKVKHVYIVGSKSIGQYGGYESFVMNLLQHHKDNKNIKYHVACKANGQGCMNIDSLPGAKRINENEFTYCNAQCFLINIPEKLGAAQAIYYDLRALRLCCEHIERNNIEEPIVYILASRVGPFEKKFVKRIHRFGGKVWQNPDGWEHARRKWRTCIRKYWKLSEQYAVKYADLVICDSKHIESYIQDEYSYYHPKTTFIAYGSYITPSKLSDDDPKYTGWLNNHNLRDGQYYISVGRFVPENNFDIMIREFMNSKTDKDFAIITTENPKYAEELQRKFRYKKDKRIKFVGTVYDAELLKKIRESAYGYFHGHEVGGTNPSLLESLGSTKLNLLLDVGFNREVAEDAALYWSKDEGSLADTINKCDALTDDQRKGMGQKAKKRIEDEYSWEYICDKYLNIMCN